jgi:aminoglycoside/choline kinase family phosphotransferase
LEGTYPWLDSVCDGAERCLGELLTAPPVVVHGEFYSRNILWREDSVYPVDWEAAALAPAEIDLASLTERWPRELAALAEQSYGASRWDGAPPAGFARRLSVARLYWHLRWLGDRREWTVADSHAWRFSALEEQARRLGLL